MASPGSSPIAQRLIGVDTLETVDPRRPVQYFGKEASKPPERKTLLEGLSWRPMGVHS